MRIFFVAVIIILKIHSWSIADDIRDFEIEGISIGDSLLNHFTKKELDNALENYELKRVSLFFCLNDIYNKESGVNNN